MSLKLGLSCVVEYFVVKCFLWVCTSIHCFGACIAVHDLGHSNFGSALCLIRMIEINYQVTSPMPILTAEVQNIAALRNSW